VDYARLVSQINKITYDEKIGVEPLVKRICDYKQAYTQSGGVRPFGTALLIAGIDEEGTHLYETDPSGSLTAYKAGSIGSGRNTVMELLERDYRDGMSHDEALTLGLKALKESSEEPLKETQVEVGHVRAGKKFTKLTIEEVKQALRALNT